MAKGACNCGAVSFEITVPLADVYQCHCSICRRYSGANGVAVVVVPNEAFRWLQGEDNIRHWDKPDADWQAHFCAICGSAMPGPNDPARMFVPAGSITEGGDDLQLAHHIWVESRAVWDVIGDEGKQHLRGFGD